MKKETGEKDVCIICMCVYIHIFVNNSCICALLKKKNILALFVDCSNSANERYLLMRDVIIVFL